VIDRALRWLQNDRDSDGVSTVKLALFIAAALLLGSAISGGCHCALSVVSR
jgi:hypothetical protein